MSDNFQKLKNEISSLYPNASDAELVEVTHNLIKFFAIGAEVIFKAQTN